MAQTPSSHGSEDLCRRYYRTAVAGCDVRQYGNWTPEQLPARAARLDPLTGHQSL